MKNRRNFIDFGEKLSKISLFKVKFKMPLFGKKDSGKKPRKDAKDIDKQINIEDKYHLKELLGT